MSYINLGIIHFKNLKNSDAKNTRSYMAALSLKALLMWAQIL